MLKTVKILEITVDTEIPHSCHAKITFEAYGSLHEYDIQFLIHGTDQISLFARDSECDAKFK